MRAANIYVENDIVIEGGPAKHAIQQTLFLYCFEPGGNRIELATGGYFIFAPDWETVTWTQAERAKGQAWRTPTIQASIPMEHPLLKSSLAILLLSGYPHLEEAEIFGEKALPLFKRKLAERNARLRKAATVHP